ncbi:MAG TPA: GtrA family protein, partial [Rhizomicrobium sp.]|nr:GtrA family protein [Rhizomicrobium sp.]
MKKLLGALAHFSILRFAVIGALGMPVDWGVLQLMVHWGTGPYLGRMISWFSAATFTWAGNRYFTFAARRARGFAATGREWGRFLAANAVGGLVNVGLYSV